MTTVGARLVRWKKLQASLEHAQSVELQPDEIGLLEEEAEAAFRALYVAMLADRAKQQECPPASSRELNEDELAEWQEALAEQHALERAALEARAGGTSNEELARLLHAVNAAQIHAATLLADAVNAKRLEEVARRWLRS